MGQPAALAFKAKTMINFFRRIRKKLAGDSKPLKYMTYALGEIVLVVIGILIALQINNWNEKRRNNIMFQESMEQVYNGLKTDIDFYGYILNELISQSELIDLVLNNSDSLSKYQCPFALHDVAWDFIELKTEIKYFTENLIYNPENREQRTMAKRLASYVLRNEKYVSSTDIDFNRILVDKGLPRYDWSTGYNFKGMVQDSTYFSEDQMEIASELIQSEDIRNLLKTIKVKTNTDIAGIGNFDTEAKSIMASIKKYYPNIRMIFENVGIIGTSIDGWNDVAISTPMKEIEFAVFETEKFLKEGDVKFRSNDTWIQNWGGNSFPEGEAISDGSNIHVDQSGIYLIRIDLNSNKYYFTKLD